MACSSCKKLAAIELPEYRTQEGKILGNAILLFSIAGIAYFLLR